MPDLNPVIKKNTLSPNMKITAFQLTPEEHADDQWRGAGIDESFELDTGVQYKQCLKCGHWDWR